MEGVGASAESARSVAVIGGGVSGLAAAYRLKSNGVQVVVFEADSRAGGKLRSGCQEGFIWDEGANTMTESEEEVGILFDDVGLRGKQQFPLSQNKRYIVKNGAPVMIPSDPVSLITNNLLSTKAKCRLLLEPLMFYRRKNPSKVSDKNLTESVGEFFQRHFGKEVVDYFVDPFVAGTSGGDPESLSMPYAFPDLWNIQEKFGSVIIGAIQSKLLNKKKEDKSGETTVKKRHSRGSFSFHGGMQTLVDALSSEVGEENLKLNSKVLSLAYGQYGNSLSDAWSISIGSNSDSQKDALTGNPFDAIIMTAPIDNVKEMKFEKKGVPVTLDFLPKVTYLPLSVLITSFKRENVKRPLEGFGVLVPSKEQDGGFKTLGTLFSSAMFPDRAPADQHLYTTFIGGSRNRDLAGATLEELKQIVLSDLHKLLGVDGEPSFIKHVYWSKAFPLYGRDYGLVLEAIDRMEQNFPGFYYAGNSRDGLSVGKAIASGLRAADLAVSYLNSSKRQG
ncbi:flavin containing amine oxidoreductase family [Wolffia australiana]